MRISYVLVGEGGQTRIRGKLVSSSRCTLLAGFSVNRRSLLLGALWGLPALSLTPAQALNSCSQGGCLAQVAFPQFAATYEQQYQSEWCWAASISMVFAYYGHPISQQRIVSEAYGAPVNMPAVSGFLIAQALNRVWIDDRGRQFKASLKAAFDAQSGVEAINSAVIVEALANGHPLVVGARGHAMVTTAVYYISTPNGPGILNVGVFDPWPGVGARNLLPDEMVPVPFGSLTFLALALIT